jgi:hypothetical protein
MRRFFSNPAVGIIGTIIGLVLSVYFYTLSQHHRDLVYVVNPVKTIIVKAGQLSRLSVNLDGKTIDTDLTAAQIAFWNQGNESIRKEHVLQRFTLYTQPKTPIIEATIRKTSREVVNIELDKTRFQDGALGVSWNILENGDGGIIQVVFAGGINTDILHSGVIEGQRSVGRVEVTRRDPTADQYPRKDPYFILWISGGIMLFFSFLEFFFKYKDLPVRSRLWNSFWAPLLLFLMMGISLYFIRETPPPFGF